MRSLPESFARDFVGFFFICLITASGFLFFPGEIWAEVVVNEFSSGTTSDWVELYNTGTESAQLSNLQIKDSTTNKKDLSGELASEGFLVVSFSNWLNNDGDIVRLVMIIGGNEDVLEEIPYGSAGGLCAPAESGSIGRFPDGGSSIVRFLGSTKGESNNEAEEDPCPTPPPSPTLTPTPELPTSTPTSKPAMSTLTPSPTKTSTPTSVSASTPISKPTGATATPSPGEVLGEEESSKEFYPWEDDEKDEQDQEDNSSSGPKRKVLPLVFLGAGFVFLFVGGFCFWYTQIR